MKVAVILCREKKTVFWNYQSPCKDGSWNWKSPFR